MCRALVLLDTYKQVKMERFVSQLVPELHRRVHLLVEIVLLLTFVVVVLEGPLLQAGSVLMPLLTHVEGKLNIFG